MTHIRAFFFVDWAIKFGPIHHVQHVVMSVGSLRRSSRLSAAVLPQASPFSNYLSPRRVTRRSLALAQTPLHTAAAASPAQLTPAQLRLTLSQTPAQAPKSQRGTPQSTQNKKDTVNVSLCFSPVKEVLSHGTQAEGNPACQSETVPESNAPTHSLPFISVVQDEPAEAVEVTPCKTPLPVSQAPEPSSCLSFTLSPCMTPTLPPISPPPAVQRIMETQESVCHTPDSSVVEVNTFSGFIYWKLFFSRCTLNEVFSCNFRKFPAWTLSDTSSLRWDAASHRRRRLP